MGLMNVAEHIGFVFNEYPGGAAPAINHKTGVKIIRCDPEITKSSG
jgi:hypothetical protein